MVFAQGHQGAAGRGTSSHPPLPVLWPCRPPGISAPARRQVRTPRVGWRRRPGSAPPAAAAAAAGVGLPAVHEPGAAVLPGAAGPPPAGAVLLRADAQHAGHAGRAAAVLIDADAQHGRLVSLSGNAGDAAGPPGHAGGCHDADNHGAGADAAGANATDGHAAGAVRRDGAARRRRQVRRAHRPAHGRDAGLCEAPRRRRPC
mmetsp:Transcript_13899/g.32308  ORF Transcript_13899/g.32308 Transcript_13899/m.32308 type:complete len:202 (+) Transcript_13899:386-991(+)